MAELHWSGSKSFYNIGSHGLNSFLEYLTKRRDERKVFFSTNWENNFLQLEHKFLKFQSSLIFADMSSF